MATFQKRQTLKRGVSYVLPGVPGVLVLKASLFADGVASAPDTLEVGFDGFAAPDAKTVARQEKKAKRAASVADRAAAAVARAKKAQARADKLTAQAAKAGVTVAEASE